MVNNRESQCHLLVWFDDMLVWFDYFLQALFAPSLSKVCCMVVL